MFHYTTGADSQQQKGSSIMRAAKYDENRTIAVIGEQTSWNVIAPGGIGNKDFANLLAAYGTRVSALPSPLVIMLLDVFQLGFIYGKKCERARKNASDITPLDC